MPAATASCPSCNAELPPAARFCASCGRRVGGDAAAVSWTVTDRRTFGVLPGRAWMRSARARMRRVGGVVRARLVQAVEILRARVEAQLDRFRLRRRAAQLSRDRAQALQDLGAAVLTEDPEVLDHAKARVTEVDGRLTGVANDLERVDRTLSERIGRARRESGVTEPAEPVPEPAPVPSDPPGPVIVPEPEPVPHEPPGPVIVPEPQPPENARSLL
ncbi:MAG TPA: zinc ribbon domain-containing protein [Gaiellaceae bacterium]